MIEESLLQAWAAQPETLTADQIKMLISEVIRMQRAHTSIHIFTPEFFDVPPDKYGKPEDAQITPDKFKGWLFDKTYGDRVAVYYYLNAGIMPQDKPVKIPPNVPTPPPQRIITNQEVINAFYEVYPQGEEWGNLVIALGDDLANEMAQNRIMTFSAYDKLPQQVKDVLGI